MENDFLQRHSSNGIEKSKSLKKRMSNTGLSKFGFKVGFRFGKFVLNRKNKY